MPDPIGVSYQGVYAFMYKATNAWNAAAEAVGANHGIEPDNPGFMPVPGRQYQDNPAILATAGQRLPSKANLMPESFTIPHALRFEGAINLFLALFFGIETVSNIDEGTTTVGQQHLLTMHDTLVGINGCGATREKTDDGSTVTNLITEIDSFKVDQVVINWTQGGRPMITPTIVPRQILEEGQTSDITNTNTELSAVTVEGSDANDAPQDAVQVRVNGRTDSALGAGDVLDVRQLTATLQRGLGEDDPTSASGGKRIEPVPTANNGWNVTLQLTFADQQARTFWRNHRDGDELKADVLFSGGLLTGAASEIFKHLLNMPAAVVMPFERTRGNRLGEQLTLRGGLPISTSSGMSDSAAPHWILANERTTQYLS